jgi:hypothetical protein
MTVSDKISNELSKQIKDCIKLYFKNHGLQEILQIEQSDC